MIKDYKCTCGKTYLDKWVEEEMLCECGKELIEMVSSPSLGGFDKFGSSG